MAALAINILTNSSMKPQQQELVSSSTENGNNSSVNGRLNVGPKILISQQKNHQRFNNPNTSEKNPNSLCTSTSNMSSSCNVAILNGLNGLTVVSHNHQNQNNVKQQQQQQSQSQLPKTTGEIKTLASAPVTGISNNFSDYISETSKKKIADLITDIEKFNDIEKLYLYLQLPDGLDSTNDGNRNGCLAGKKKPISNPFGKKADTEVMQTYAWIRSHLEEDVTVSMPKHEVYEDYKAFCEANHFEKLCVADFGKAMKHVFPQVKPRRLGQRGSSKYCYSGLRKKITLNPPELPFIDPEEDEDFKKQQQPNQNQSESPNLVNDIAWNIIMEWVEKAFNRKFRSNIDFAKYLVDTKNIKTELSKALIDNQQILKDCRSKSATTFQVKASNAKAASSNNKNASIKNNRKKLSDKKKILENNDSQYISNGNLVQTTNLQQTPVSNSATVKILLSQPTTAFVEPNLTFTGSQAMPLTMLTAKANLNGMQKENCKEIKEEFSDELSFQKLEESNDKNYKRQMNDEKNSFIGSSGTKKRHIADISDLRVNELENEALNDYLNNGNNSHSTNLDCLGDSSNTTGNNNPSDFIQIKKMLECHLAKPLPNGNIGSATKLQNHPQSNFQLCKKNQNSTLHSLLVNLPSKDTNPGLMIANNNSLNEQNKIFAANNQQQRKVSSPLVSRNAFSFQPISPGNTPIILENSVLEINPYSKNTVNGNNMNSMSQKQTTSVSVGPSQPSSEANSPFVSPRNTPISLPRSRNNSGQSVYSQNNYRQTPVQNLDSGVSSISSSPFISPQSTPIPMTRIRSIETPNINNANNVNGMNNSNGNLIRNNNIRVRHSSGPGGPVGRTTQLANNLMIYNRSYSLSPMITNENGLNGSSIMQSNQRCFASTLNGLNNNNNNNTFDRQLNQKLSVVTQTESHNLTKENNFFNFNEATTIESQQQNNMNVFSQQNSINNKLNTSRQRHFSNPYGGVSTMVKNEDSEFDSLLHRSHSVPLHQMFESSNAFESISMNNFLPQHQHQEESMLSNSINLNEQENSISKSYPNTPVCQVGLTVNDQTNNNNLNNNINDILNSTSLDDLLTNNDNIIQQDLIVSSVHLDQSDTSTNSNHIDSISVQQSTVPTLENFSNDASSLIKSEDDDRNGFNDLLINDSDVDQFKDAFQDCDNDFPNLDLENTDVAVYPDENF